ncbi:TPA: NYN domain-containing protein [archaeon]|nr:NYN domain-containing protein [Candidatus Naiadarchaeales archaeon SRR2090159.bin1288]
MANLMENTWVFLDAGYLNKIAKYFGGGQPIGYDINQFAITLAKANNLWCKGVFYYTAPPYQSSRPTPDEADRKRKYDRFISKLNKIPDFTVREGRCQKQDGGQYVQKGVDTLLVMDLLSCKEKGIKTIVVLACDTDFVPVLNKLRKEHGIKIILAYFSDYKRRSEFSMSNHILTACDFKFLVQKEHFDAPQFHLDGK